MPHFGKWLIVVIVIAFIVMELIITNDIRQRNNAWYVSPTPNKFGAVAYHRVLGTDEACTMYVWHDSLEMITQASQADTATRIRLALRPGAYDPYRRYEISDTTGEKLIDGNCRSKLKLLKPADANRLRLLGIFVKLEK